MPRKGYPVWEFRQFAADVPLSVWIEGPHPDADDGNIRVTDIDADGQPGKADKAPTESIND